MKIMTVNFIADQQLRWAIQENVPLKGYTYTKTVEDNVFNHELHPETRKEYAKGKGHELEGERAHIKALHSSSALVVNVFDYWRHQNRIQDIASCCGAEGIVTGMEFEKTHPIKGVARIPPHLDIEFAGSIPLAIESKFTEPYHRKTRRNKKDTHLAEYLKHHEIWSGILKVRALAESIVRQSGTKTDFEYLDVPQLIKHILGLKGNHGGSFCLLYLWYKVNSPEANRHEEELAKFSTYIGDEIDFRVMTYQDLFSSIKSIPGVAPAYLQYLERRYFSIT